MKSNITIIRMVSKIYDNRMVPFPRRKYNGAIRCLDKSRSDKQDFVACKATDNTLFNLASLVPLIPIITGCVISI
jgi:hypothetical protein